jgi:hypothetical protein
MASSAPESVATMPTMDTEDGSITGGLGIASGKRRSTPFDKLRINEFKSVEMEESMVEEFIAYNESLAWQDCCLLRARASSKKDKRCQCLHVLRDSVHYCEAVSQYQLYFGKLKRDDQQRIVVQWIRSSLLHYDGPQHSNRYAQLSFPIPFLLGEDGATGAGGGASCSGGAFFDNLRQAKICRDSLMDLIGAGRDWWKTCLRHALNNTLPEYKLKGKRTNRKRKWDDLYFDSLVDHFKELPKEAGPVATRFVREKTGKTTTRDHNEKVEYLAPNFTKRRCYYRYSLSRGAKVTSNNKGIMIIFR